MIELEKQLPYGMLNPISENNSNKSDIDINTYSIQTSIQEIIKDKYTSNVFEGRVLFTAIVLKLVDENQNGQNLMMNLLPLLNTQKVNTVKFIARIPELHAHLPIPSSDEDIKILSMYPVFEGSQELGKPQQGALVKVTFDDISAQSNPTFIGLINSEGSPTSNNLQGDKTSAKNSFNSSLSPKDPNYVTKPMSSAKNTITQLNGYKRNNPIDLIVIHESAGRGGIDGTINALAAKGASVHWIIDRDGTTKQLLDESLAGAHGEGYGAGVDLGSINSRSIAIEIVNKAKGPPIAGETAGKSVWTFPDGYIFPTKVQVEKCWQLIQQICNRHAIPVYFPANFDKQNINFGTYKEFYGKKGIMCHKRWAHMAPTPNIAHGDGAFIENYCYLRSLSFTPNQAYQDMIDSYNPPYGKKRGLNPIPSIDRVKNAIESSTRIR